jgi:hypothetical protein
MATTTTKKKKKKKWEKHTLEKMPFLDHLMGRIVTSHRSRKKQRKIDVKKEEGRNILNNQ